MRDPVFDCGVAQNFCVTETDQNRTFSVTGKITGDGYRAHFIRSAIAGSGHFFVLAEELC